MGVKSDSHKTLEVSRQALSAIVFAFMRCILAAPPGSPKMLRLLQKMSAAIRRHVRLNAKLYAHILREDLSRSPALRARICRELGGKMAMVNWEVRRRGARIGGLSKTVQQKMDREYKFKPSAKITPKAPRPKPSKPRKRWQPRTDRFGEYRLAVIKTGQRTTRKMSNLKTRRVNRTRTWRFHPVETTPDDLRVDVYFDDRFPPPSENGGPSAGHSPPIERPPI